MKEWVRGIKKFAPDCIKNGRRFFLKPVLTLLLHHVTSPPNIIKSEDHLAIPKILYNILFQLMELTYYQKVDLKIIKVSATFK